MRRCLTNKKIISPPATTMMTCKKKTNLSAVCLVIIQTTASLLKFVWSVPKNSPLIFLGNFSDNITTLPNHTEVVLFAAVDEDAATTAPFFRKMEPMTGPTYLAKLKTPPNAALTITFVAALRAKSPTVEGAG